jgi:hypothetical protein
MNIYHAGCIIYETEIQDKMYYVAIPEFAWRHCRKPRKLPDGPHEIPARYYRTILLFFPPVLLIFVAYVSGINNGINSRKEKRRMSHRETTHFPTTRLFSALFMTRPLTWGLKEFLNEMLARFSGTLANVSSLRDRPLVTKTGYILWPVIIYYTRV